MSENANKCAHQSCKCPPPEGKQYCSDHCEKNAEASKGQTAAPPCHCHHQQCGPHHH